MKASSVKYLIKLGVRSVWVNRVMTFASFCIMLVSMMLIGLAVLTSMNLNRIIGSIEDKNEVIVQIYDTAPDSEVEALGDKLRKTANVAEVRFYSRDEALEDIKADMSEEEQTLFDMFEENPLPNVYRIKIDDLSLMSETVLFIASYDFVEQVREPTDFAALLTDIRNIIAFISIGVVAALVIVCLVIISNTTRTSVFTRRKEISIMKYVGATNTFIRVPFFVEGLMVGLLAAAVASVLTKLIYDAVFNIFAEGFKLWSYIGVSSLIPSGEVMLLVTLCYIGAGALIGAIGTTISTGKHLKV